MIDSLAGLTGRRVSVDGAGAPAEVRDLQAVILDASFEVLLAGWDSVHPAPGKLRALHKWRLGTKNFSLVVAVTDRQGEVWLAGPGGKDQPVGPLTESEAARMLQAALEEPSDPSAHKRIADLLKARRKDDSVPGLGGEGLFAQHYLSKVLPGQGGWRESVARARPWLGLRGRALIEAMGFSALRVRNGFVLTDEIAQGNGGGVGLVRARMRWRCCFAATSISMRAARVLTLLQ